VQHKLTISADKSNVHRRSAIFAREISQPFGNELTRGLPMQTKRIDTPMPADWSGPTLMARNGADFRSCARANVFDGWGLDAIPSPRVGFAAFTATRNLQPSNTTLKVQRAE